MKRIIDKLDRLRRPERIQADEDTLRRGYDHCSATIRNSVFTLTGVSLIAAITVSRPDHELLLADAEVNVPFANLSVSLDKFITLLPLIIAALTVYAIVFVIQRERYGALPAELRTPYIFSIPHWSASTLSAILLYAQPIAVMFYLLSAGLHRSDWTYLTTFIALFAALLLVAALVQANRRLLLPILATAAGFVLVAIMIWVTPQSLRSQLQALRPLNLTGADLTGKPLQGVSLRHANLTGATLTGIQAPALQAQSLRAAWVKLDRAQLPGADFSNADLTNAEFSTSDIEGAIFDKATLTNAGISSTQGNEASFQEASGEGARFRHSTLVTSKFNGAHFEAPDFSGADLSGAVFDDVIFHAADFTGAKLDEASFLRAELSGFVQVTMDQIERPDGVRFEKANLTLANLSDARIGLARFQNALLDAADLTRVSGENPTFQCAQAGMAKFDGAELYDAKFEFSNLIGATFENANLSGSIFAHSRLIGANFRGADLSHVWFVGANLYERGRPDQFGGVSFRLNSMHDQCEPIEDALPRTRHIDTGRADFRGAIGLTCDILMSAIGWQETFRDPELACGAPIPEPK